MLPVQGPVELIPPPFVHVEVCAAEAKLVKAGAVANAATVAIMTAAIINVLVSIEQLYVQFLHKSCRLYFIVLHRKGAWSRDDVVHE